MPTVDNIDLNQPDPFNANTWLEILKFVNTNEYFPKLKDKYAPYHVQRNHTNAHGQAKLTLRLLIPPVLYSYAWKQVVKNMAAHPEKDYVDPVSCHLNTIPICNFMFIKYVNPLDYLSIAISACVIFYSTGVLAYSVTNMFKLPLSIWGLPVLEIGIILCQLLNLTPGLCFAINYLQCASYQSRSKGLPGDYSYWYYELDGKNRYLHSPYLSLFPNFLITIVVGLMIITGLRFGLTASRRDPPNRNNIINQPLIMIIDSLLNRLPCNLYPRFIDVFYRTLYRNAISFNKLKQFKQDFDEAYNEAANSLPIFPASPLAKIFSDTKLKFKKTISTEMLVTCCDGVTYDVKNLEKYIQKCVESHDPNAKCKEGEKLGILFFKPFKNPLQIFSPIIKHICIAKIGGEGWLWFKVPFTYKNFTLQNFQPSDMTTDNTKWIEAPITHNRFNHPFITSAGHSYSSDGLFEWISKSKDRNGNFIDPMTNKKINRDQLAPNLTVARLIMSTYTNE
jgi:hypothetical protein